MSFFDHVPLAQMDAILGLEAEFRKDPRTSKINLTAGVYKDESLKTPVMDAVKQAERFLLESEKSKQYLPIEGDPLYLSVVGKKVFSPLLWEKVSKVTSSFQTIGGTGALRLGAEVIKSFLGAPVFIPSPTWPNHRGIFLQSGLVPIDYPYYNKETNTLDFDKLCHFLNGIEEKSVVLLHACCHNPSGMDLSKKQWDEIAKICLAKKLLPFIDAAYLGFGDSFDEDCYAIRLFAELGMEMLVAISFSKNFSLYGERVGALFVLTQKEVISERLLSQMKILVRRNYSNPQRHGAEVVLKVLCDARLSSCWDDELSRMRGRIDSMRKQFSLELQAKVQSKDYSYLSEARGMFCFCGLTRENVERLIKDFAIYMTFDGRINVAGLLPSTVDYVVSSIKKVLE